MRRDFVAEATPEEAAEYGALLARAAAIDEERRSITARLNVMRQRLMQRRLARERGRPFQRIKARAALSAAGGR